MPYHYLIGLENNNIIICSNKKIVKLFKVLQNRWRNRICRIFDIKIQLCSVNPEK